MLLSYYFNEAIFSIHLGDSVWGVPCSPLPSKFCPMLPAPQVRDISLTMGAGGLLNQWGGSLNSETLFWGYHSIPGPIYGGINKSSSWRDHKIDLMEDHWLKFFAAMLRALLFM